MLHIRSHLRPVRLLAVAALLSLTACASVGQPRVGVAYVRYGPPPLVREYPGPRPGLGAIWIPGRYVWRGTGYAWLGGRYEYPARGYRRYEPGRWRHSRAGWYWSDGRWW